MSTQHPTPLFPLHTVLFPGGLLPLRLFEQRYLEMAKRSLRDEQPFGVCLIREGTEVGAPAVPEPVGCMARIAHWDMPQLGMLEILARGESRFRILESHVQKDGLTLARVEPLSEDQDAPIEGDLVACAQLLRRALESNSDAGVEKPFQFESCSWVSARLTELLPLPLPLKQQLLELADARERLGRIRDLLGSSESQA